MKPVNIGILGLGTVGSGVINLLHRNAMEISRRAGRNISVKTAIVQNVGISRECETTLFRVSNNLKDVTDDPEIDIVIELIGGTDIAKDAIYRALNNQKHVVTANKALVAEFGNEIFALALEKKLTVAFEAAVGGGISVIKVLREGLSGNMINRVVGIINGTSNYILTDMFHNSIEFSDSLKEAVKLGFAEANPENDIEGIDAAHKLAILASIAYGIPLQFKKVYVEGIKKITSDDVLYAEELGYKIKHLGIAARRDEGLELRAHPCLVSNNELLANVNGVMNAIYIEGDAVGSTLHYGAGAGSEPTASAVVADIVDIARALTTDPNSRVPHLAFQPQSLSDLRILDAEKTKVAFYLRLNVHEKAGVLADITRILGERTISIEKIVQKEVTSKDGTVPIVIITHETIEQLMNSAINEIKSLESVEGEISRIRLETFGS
ncbi:MAG: homoserine dehydrogenase [Acidiferrobacteraceae bacterium]|nr:homoserine dehydrogenase [Acidiferrobacteraceae bacterium]|tara:strand:- start:11711 stop:13024 length:1314 start_codon:yes stop_codon:yes gene_type:complete